MTRPDSASSNSAVSMLRNSENKFPSVIATTKPLWL
jgi:hypothetical protein